MDKIIREVIKDLTSFACMLAALLLLAAWLAVLAFAVVIYGAPAPPKRAAKTVPPAKAILGVWECRWHNWGSTMSFGADGSYSCEYPAGGQIYWGSWSIEDGVLRVTECLKGDDRWKEWRVRPDIGPVEWGGRAEGDYGEVDWGLRRPAKPGKVEVVN